MNGVHKNITCTINIYGERVKIMNDKGCNGVRIQIVNTVRNLGCAHGKMSA